MYWIGTFINNQYEELFQSNESRNVVENVRNVPENVDEDDHDENLENVAFDENTW